MTTQFVLKAGSDPGRKRRRGLSKRVPTLRVRSGSSGRLSPGLAAFRPLRATIAARGPGGALEHASGGGRVARGSELESGESE